MIQITSCCQFFGCTLAFIHRIHPKEKIFKKCLAKHFLIKILAQNTKKLEFMTFFQLKISIFHKKRIFFDDLEFFPEHLASQKGRTQFEQQCIKVYTLCKWYTRVTASWLTLLTSTLLEIIPNSTGRGAIRELYGFQQS